MESTVKLLQKIRLFNHFDGDTTSYISSTYLKNHFGKDYVIKLESLESKNYLRTGHSYKVGTETEQGICKQFDVTADGIDFLNQYNKNRLKQLRHDKKAKRLNQQKISNRGYNKLTYQDSSLQSIKDVIDGIDYDESELETVIESLPTSKQDVIRYLLVTIQEKNYGELHKNLSDNRVWNPYTNLPSELKPILKIDNQPYYKTIDIKSCHWSLFGELLKQTYLPLSYHIVGYNHDILVEVEKWNSLFLSKETHAKDIITQQTSIPNDKVKDVMNSYINGKGFKQCKNKLYLFNHKRGNWKKLNDWMVANFPMLYKMWLQTDIKTTGNNIAKYFETKIIQDPRIYAKAKELGYRLGNENDGFSIYSKNTSENDFAGFLKFIEDLSIELIGVQVIFVDKTSKTIDFAQLALESKQIKVVSELEKMLSKETVLRKRFFGIKNCESKQSYVEYKNKVDDYLMKHSKTIQSIESD